MKARKIGLALGGGGVRGLAHIPALQVLDELGVKPDAVAGTSMGAIVGALYASGLSGTEIRAMVEKLVITRDDHFKDVLAKGKYLLQWLKAIRLDTDRRGLLRADGFIAHLLEQIRATTFEELAMPLRVVATDFWSAEQVVFDRGPLLPALQASMAVPGVFAPVVVDGRVLVDGGVVNNVPYDLLEADCKFTIAIDVAPERLPDEQPVPNMMEAVMGMFDILQDMTLERKLLVSRPDVYLHPRLLNILTFDFNRIEEVLDQADPAMEELRTRLRALSREAGRGA